MSKYKYSKLKKSSSLVNYFVKLSQRRLKVIKLSFLYFFFLNKNFCDFFFNYKTWKRLQLPLRIKRFKVLKQNFLIRKKIEDSFSEKSNDLFLRDSIKKRFKFTLYKLVKKKQFKNYRKRRKSFVLRGFFLEGLRMATLIQQLYGLKRKNLRQYALKAKNEIEFCKLLELRLDVIIFRCGFFSSVYEARQAVISGFIYVNKRCVVLPSYYVSLGDCISVSNNGRNIIFFNYVYRFLNWRRSYRYNICFFQRSGCNFFEIDFLRLRILIFRDLTCKDVGIYRYRPKNWYQSKVMPKKSFQVGLDYGFLYKFLLYH